MPAVWSEPATPAEVKAATMHLLDAIEPNAEGPRLEQVYRLIKRRGYSRAELVLAAEEVPFRNHYGEHLKLHVVDEIITQHRKDRKRLQRTLTEKQVMELLERRATELDPDAFKVCGQDAYDNDLYRYVPNEPAPRHDPEPFDAWDYHPPDWLTDGDRTLDALTESLSHEMQSE